MHYQIITNTSCNLACKYCFEEYKDSFFINAKEIDNIVNFIYKDMHSHFGENISINISGGECLLNFSNLKLLVEKLNKTYTNIIWEISSNATLLTAQKIEYFNSHNFDYFLSLDGIQHSHDLNRMTKDGKKSYDKVFKNISNVYKSLKNPKKLIINSVITPNNVKYVSENFNFLRSYFNLATVSMNIAYNQNWTTNDLIILKEKLHELGSIYAKGILKTKRIGFDFFDRQIKRNVLNLSDSEILCSAGKKTITILPTGVLISCGDFSGQKCHEVEIGNVISGIDVNKVEKFLSKCSKEELFSDCRNCAFINKCSNYCPSRNFYSHKKLFEISDVECSISKIIIEEADFIINEISSLGEDFFLKNYFEI